MIVEFKFVQHVIFLVKAALTLEPLLAHNALQDKIEMIIVQAIILVLAA